MNRARFVLAALTVGWLMSGFTAGSVRAEEKTAAGKMAPFVHTVIFSLKKDAPEGEAAAAIEDAHKLSQVPSVRRLKVGRPAEKGTPELAHKDFQVGLLVLFDNDEGLQEYINHPLHKEFVKKHLPYMDKVEVYDFVDQPR